MEIYIVWGWEGHSGIMMAHNLLNYAATSHGQKYYPVLFCISFMSSPWNCGVSNIHQGSKVNFSLPVKMTSTCSSLYKPYTLKDMVIWQKDKMFTNRLALWSDLILILINHQGKLSNSVWPILPVNGVGGLPQSPPKNKNFGQNTIFSPFNLFSSILIHFQPFKPSLKWTSYEIIHWPKGCENTKNV